MVDELAAKYPFSEKAKEYLNRANVIAVSGEELDLGVERLFAALRGNALKLRKDPKQEIVSYVLARILLGALNSSRASAKFANAEARRAIELMKEEEMEVVQEIAREFLPSLELREKIAGISILDYLKYGSDLANESVGNGKVQLEKGSFQFLLKRAIESKIADVSFDSKSLPQDIKSKAEELKEEVERLTAITGKIRGRFEGKYLSLPAVKKILEGLPEGKRYYGSMTLAIACLKDGIAKEEAESLLITYARNCSKSTHSFSEKEALASLEWVYKHPTINFSLKTLREQGILDEHTLAETALQFNKLSRKVKR